MNVNKKLGRLRQWAAEQMGGERRTILSDDFKVLELEMIVRYEGMLKLFNSMTAYIKAISKRNEADGKEKSLPVGYLGNVMINHGEDFEHDSEFGRCLIGFGRTHEKIAQYQETYIIKASSSWLESLNRSIDQMKDYQTARKKLDNRRLAYDALLGKLQRQKKEDPQVEEELCNARVEYDEISDDVYRRMQEIKEAEAESVTQMNAFVDAELSYHENCHKALLQLKYEWPATKQQQSTQARSSLPHTRARTNTRTQNQCVREDDQSPPPSPEPEQRPSIKYTRSVSSRVATEPARVDLVTPFNVRPVSNRSTTFEGPTKIRREVSPAPNLPRLARGPSDSLTISTQRSHLRNVNNAVQEYNTPDDQTDSPFSNSSSSPDRSYSDASVSPATPYGSVLGARLKGAPPPPPSRTKKPPPPPPPAKRGVMA